jgi:hypothetical protein
LIVFGDWIAPAEHAEYVSDTAVVIHLTLHWIPIPINGDDSISSRSHLWSDIAIIILGQLAEDLVDAWPLPVPLQSWRRSCVVTTVGVGGRWRFWIINDSFDIGQRPVRSNPGGLTVLQVIRPTISSGRR